ncbi:MAG TPA: flagellin FliC [Halieaceae bacterium]|nr:flagellin FliC [Halieaceae bacterium]
MPLSIATNLASMTAQRSFLNSNAALETAFERLSTGKRVNSSADDAAGLAIGTSLLSRVSGLNQAIRNVNDGISMVQIAEGTMDEVTTILQRMRDLAVQGYSGSLSATELAFLETEHDKLAAALDSALDQAKFNGTDLIGGSAVTLTIQSGANAGETTSIVIDALTASGLGVADGDIDFTSLASAGADITAIQSALDAVAEDRAKLGATQSQLESTVRNLANVAENTAAAAGRIMDTDYAAETANLTKAQILQQAATSVLAQANAQPQAVLSLLQQ